eukprot:TRINITY_DN6267_c0_g1_i1.p1 TRINITY_DN6267_c0_g1~~TRINITY_DN6267_c0_g1_i1.p1  ORF type:complete len:389 (+),score=39.50 TRINITY_DN6267_c0_g1_i1:52-1218(+)
MKYRVLKCLGGFTAGLGAGSVLHAQEMREMYATYGADAEYPEISGSTHLAGGVLTKELWRANFKKRTEKGFKFNDAVQPGIDNQVGGPWDAGCVAGDEESYYVFKDLYNPILTAKHGWSEGTAQPQDMNPDSIRGGNLNSQYVINVRIRSSRNFQEHRYYPVVRRGEREEINWYVKHACRNLSTPFQGKWVDLPSLSLREIEEHVSKGLIGAKPSSPFVVSAGASRDWPVGRGAHISKSKDILVWANDCDHLKVISTLRGGNLALCFNRWSMANIDLESAFHRLGKHYSYHRSLGFLGPSLANVGTAMRITVVGKFPNASQHPDFPAFLERHRLTQNPSATGGVTEISNSARWGQPETALVQNMIDSLEKLIDYEKQLENKVKVARLV